MDYRNYVKLATFAILKQIKPFWELSGDNCKAKAFEHFAKDNRTVSSTC